MTGKVDVTIYTVPMCSQCIRLKEFLNFHDVEYREVNLHQEEDKGKFLKEKTGQSGAPVTEVGKNFVVGFDRERILELLDEKGFDISKVNAG